MAIGYWGQNYWHVNYWDEDYWSETGTASGDYWNDDYWNVNYWDINYWLEFNDGDVTQRTTPAIPLSVQIPTVEISLNIEPGTESLPLVAFQADANLDIDPPITAPNLPLNAFNPSLGFAGYQLGDIDTRWVPDSTISLTFGVNVSVPSLSFAPMTHTVEADGGINVGVSVESLSLNTLVTNARLDIEVQPLPPGVPLASFDTTAGVGIVIPATQPGLSFTTGVQAVEGIPDNANIFATLPQLPLAAFGATIVATIEDGVPDSTFGDYGGLILNGDAVPFPSNYEICERTGFRVLPGQLRKEWNNTMVRAKSFEARHPQDFVRARAEKLEGSIRPEQTDRFIGIDVPEVTIEDLK